MYTIGGLLFSENIIVLCFNDKHTNMTIYVIRNVIFLLIVTLSAMSSSLKQFKMTSNSYCIDNSDTHSLMTYQKS